MQAEPERPEQLICVAPDYVAKVWPHVTRLIERALIRGNADHDHELIKAKLESGDSLLWIVWSGKELIAAATTELVAIEGKGKICVVTSGAGRDLRKWDRFLWDLERYAHDEGCQALRLYGRHGWARYFRDRGYAQPWIILEKPVS